MESLGSIETHMNAGQRYWANRGWPLQKVRTDPIATEPIPPLPKLRGSDVFGNVGHSVGTSTYGFMDTVTRNWALHPMSPPEAASQHAANQNAANQNAASQNADNQNTSQKITGPKHNEVVDTAVDPRLDTRFSLYDLSRDEVDTATALVNSATSSKMKRYIRMLPTHHINSLGELSGYRFSVSAGDSCGALPVNRSMFHGTSAVQCTGSLGQEGGGSTNVEAVRLLKDIPGCVEKMRTLMHDISDEAAAAVDAKTLASLDCSPFNTDAVVTTESRASGGRGSMSLNASASRARDSRKWTCDEPHTIGIYHAFARRFNHSREHRIYIICTGGCRTACDEFMNLTTDLAAGTHTTAGELCDSEETWWLRKLCSRTRCRLLHRVAEAFGLCIPTMDDVQAFDPGQVLAVPNIETYAHDICMLRDGDVAVYNECVDTTAPRNGIICSMNPSEGFWLFKGPPCASNGTADYGGVFGKQQHCGVFPTSASQIVGVVQRHSTNSGCPIVTDFGGGGAFVFKDETRHSKSAQHMKFDENFFRNLEKMQWARDNGVVELMPIVVGVFN
ncbi:hypothetical protein T484DRAFT_1756997 [Baffinella frigidus]|nr:hypothetical protein T484DRAFT_1756997 [Cryptophyta sp. CCMP2293]